MNLPTVNACQTECAETAAAWSCDFGKGHEWKSQPGRIKGFRKGAAKSIPRPDRPPAPGAEEWCVIPHPGP